MAQVVTFPRTISFTRTFEELPLFAEKTKAGEVFFAGLLDGTLEVSFEPSGEWTITDIHIKVENGRYGKQAEAKIVPVNGDDNPALYWLMLDVLTDKLGATIDEWVYWEAQERGIRLAA